MRSKEFIESVVRNAAELGGRFSQKDASILLKALGLAAAAALKRGDVVKLPGIGLIKSRITAEHMAYNPKTREPIKIPARRKAGLVLAKALKEALFQSTPR